jgi:glycosyltransferase involved in cell wall biosynthesis
VLFVRDDASIDETSRILRSFAASAPFPVEVRRNPDRLGYNLNYAAVLDEPETDLIALCDQDDVWYPRKLSVLCRLLAEDAGAAGACADARRVAGDGRSLGRTIWQRLEFGADNRMAMSMTGELGSLLRNNVVPGSTLVIRSSFRDLVLPFSGHGFYDYWIALLLQAVSHLVFAPEPLQEYRVHGDNAVGLDRPGYSMLRAARQSWKARTGSAARSDQSGGRVMSVRSRRLLDHKERASFSRDVLERVSASGYPISTATRVQLDEWATFNAFRASLSPRLARRVGDVTRELRRGRYASQTSSAMSAVYDIVLG